MRRIVMGLLLSALLHSAPPTSPDDVTYDWLIDTAKNTAYTDHIPHFRRLFNTIKVRGFLECGCGYSTKYFMDHCDKVVSIEFLMGGTDLIWYNQCLKLYKGCKKWEPLVFNQDLSDQSFDNACAYACTMHKDYSLVDPRYMDSLDEYFKEQIRIAHLEGKDIDVAFVDPGVYIRGDMVKLFLMNEVPIVAAHDTACDPGEDAQEGIYWFVVQTPPDYEKIRIPFGQGTTFWISHKLPHVIASMKAYREQIVAAHNQEGASFAFLTKIADQL